MNLPVKLWRIARIFGGYRARRETVDRLPIRLWVESCSACNLQCGMCPNKDLDVSEKGSLPFDLFRRLVDEVKGQVQDMYLHHRGEPFLNPALFDMIRYAQAAGIKTRFHSNGTLMDEVRARALLDAGPDLVSFSVDGFEKQAYESVRVGASFEKTLENIFRLLDLRRERGLRRPYIVIEKIIFNHPGAIPSAAQRAQAAALARRFAEAGVDEVIEKAEYLWAGETAPEPAAGRQRAAVCTFPWYAAVVCRDGRVTPCPQDFHAKMVMGDLNHQTLGEIWNGPAYRALRHRQAHDLAALPLCRKCDRLHRKTVAGVPLQYMLTFLTDHLVGYNRRLRRWIGTAERN